MNIPRLLFRLLLGRRLPIISGSLKVRGIAGPVTVRRDTYGIPYIEAEDDDDAWFGLGFCQAQDRAFQLETMLRVARGTLAELLGPRGLPMDRLSRRIGFSEGADRQLQVLTPELRRLLEAFARGVNQGAGVGCKRVAHEFTLLRTRPTAFTPTDVIAIARLLSFGLSSNWDIELARLRVLRTDGPEALAALDPAYPVWHPVSVPPGAAAGESVDRLSEDLTSLRELAGFPGGSNNWALGPSRTSSGRPMLANDPHQPPTLPPHWYLAHVRTPRWSVAGATLAGLPAFASGHNGAAAWGITAGLADTTDLFLEELSPDGRSVREADGFVPCRVREETIRVRGRPDHVERVVVTPRGPIVGPALDGEADAISLRATWLDPRPIMGLLTAYRATSFEEFRHSFQEWPLMSLNVLYADTSGTIGWQMVGEVPRRRKGWGTVPRPGWDPEAGWEEDGVPFANMPHTTNPPGGILATANNQPARETEGPFLGVDWIDGYRVARILESLEARSDWDLKSNQRLQMDEYSLPWRELREIVLATPADSGDVARALEVLKGWDGVVSAHSPAAAVFQHFVAEMTRRTAEAKAPRSSAWVLGKGFTQVLPHTLFVARRVGHLVRLLRDQPAGWFQETWPQTIGDSLAASVKSLRSRYGEEESSWAWGRIRTLTLPHPAGGRRYMSSVFNRGPFPWGGEANTISQAAADPANPTANPMVIAALRMVVDVGNWEENRFSLPGGQSGNPLSPHYDDMLPLWLGGEGVPIAWSPARVLNAARTTLRLTPEEGVA